MKLCVNANSAKVNIFVNTVSQIADKTAGLKRN